jgi:hypothetical protein
MKRIILLSGKIGSGKNTFADMLKEELGDKAYLEAFARPLKELCRDAFRPLTDYLNRLLALASGTPETTTDAHWFEKKNGITRHILQIVGTDIVRRVDPDYWVKATIKNIRARREDIIIMTDWRFPSELNGLGCMVDWHLMTVRINRDVPREGVEHEHSSETALDFFAMDMTIGNYGSLFDLKKKAQDLAYTLIEETLD